MNKVQKATIWLTVLSACAGSASILAFLLTQQAQDYLLFSAVITATISVVALIAHVFFITPVSVFKPHPTKCRIVMMLPSSLRACSICYSIHPTKCRIVTILPRADVKHDLPESSRSGGNAGPTTQN